MAYKYSEEKNVQILIAVLKSNNIKKVVVDPGTTNISFVVSLMNDEFFELYSAVDERGAAYIACGLSSESGEPVVITCTGATASRNYYPGLTEAYHRKLPVLAVTASQDFNKAGNLSAQYIDRTIQPADSVKMSVQVPIVRNASNEYEATIKINKAVLELFRKGGGPVHINLASSYSNVFDCDDLSHVRIMKRYKYNDSFPEIKKGRIAIVVGAHKTWSDELTNAVDSFCSIYNAFVIVDHSSHYWGKYRVLPTILSSQEQHKSNLMNIDLLIHIGEEQGDYYTDTILKNNTKEVWRVSPDGEIRDTYGCLTNVFEMDETTFFARYTIGKNGDKHEYLDSIKKEIASLYKLIPELPFSNIWIAQHTIPVFSSEYCLELGVSNTMRSWTFFDFESQTYVLANTGCRGIDGAIPTLLGMSLANPNQLHFAVMGDLTFFYSFNVLGNRHISNNIRILLVNNGCGVEFNLYPHRARKLFGNDNLTINKFIAAGGHSGNKSKSFVKHFAEDLGFLYLTASSKEEYLKYLSLFLRENNDKPILFEVFTEISDEDEALKLIRNVKVDLTASMKATIKKVLGR